MYYSVLLLNRKVGNGRPMGRYGARKGCRFGGGAEATNSPGEIYLKIDL